VDFVKVQVKSFFYCHFSLRLPVGDTFIPRTSHKKLTQPKQKIPIGVLIEPMDKEVLVKRGILPAKSLDIIQ
jgi:hypothetical protein